MISFIQHLRQHLSEEDYSKVLPALQQDPIVWRSLSDDIFQARAREIIGKQSSKWSPAQLGLIALDSPIDIESLLQHPLQSVHEALSERANSTLEAFLIEPGEFEFDLANAALIALALREDYIATQSWDKLISFAATASNRYGPTIIAMLYGMLPEPEEMLKALFNTKTSDGLGQLGLHGILSNPLNGDEQSSLLGLLLNSLNIKQQVSVLRPLSGQRNGLAKSVARQLVKQPKSLSRQALNLRQQAELHQVSGQYADALQTLQQAWKSAQSAQVDAIVGLASEAARNKAKEVAEAALEQAIEFAGEAGSGDARLQLLRLDLGAKKVDSQINIDDISLAENEEQPEALILAAQLASSKGLTENAAAFATNALGKLNKQAIASSNLQRLAELLLDLGLPHDAIKAAELGLENLSNNPTFLYILSRAQHMARQLEAAAQNAYAAATQDDDPIIQRHLIEVLMDIEFWEAAQTELQRLIEEQNKPEAQDLCNLADCALHMQQPEKAAEAGQRAIHLYPDNGYAHSLLGKALMQLGNPQNASEHLRKATQLSPDMAEAWLALADYYSASNENSKALNTLQSGVKAAPQAVELHYALGQAHLNSGSEDKALEAFEDASKLLETIENQSNPLSKSIVLDLGNTLQTLGQIEKAQNAFQKAFQNYPNDSDIAAAYAGILMQQSEYRPALEVLAVILEQNAEDLNANMNLARAHLALNEQAETAIAALQIVLQQVPDQQEAILLLAEAYTLNADAKQAFEAYSQVLNTEFAKAPQWRLRIQLGLADVALELGKPDVAIATLQDAQLVDPGNTSILQSLSKAYQAADLPHEAFQTAREAYAKSADDLNVLLWFAEQAASNESPAEASEALKRAVELQPDDAKTLLKLGQTQLQLGADVEAKVSFRKLLDTEKATSKTLLAAAKSVQQLDHAEAGLEYLQRAQKISATPDKDLLAALFDTYKQTGEKEKALDILESQLELEPDTVSLLGSKAQLLVELGRTSAALACLEHALQLAPGDAKLHYQAAQVFRSTSDLLKALDHAEQALSLAPEDADMRYLAAETALACLRPERASRILEIVSKKTEAFSQNVELLNLAAEVLLDESDHSAAETLLVEDNDEELNIVTTALKARLAFAQHDAILGEQLLAQTVQAVTKDTDKPAVISIAKAAIEASDWETAIQLASQAVKQNTEEPAPHLMLATALVERAEYAQRCRLAGSQHGNNFEEWTDNKVWSQFEQALKQAKATAPFEDTHHSPAHLYARGVDIFAPEKHEAKIASYPTSAAEVATALSNHKGNLDLEAARKLAQKHPKDSFVLLALAGLLETENPAKALEAAARAVEGQPNNPLLHAMTARLAYGIEDLDTAAHHIDTALSIWEDETEWQALAGQIHAALGDKVAAIEHFEKAHELAPKDAGVLYNLGQANIAAGKTDEAIQAFEKSLDIEKDQPEVLFALGQAQHKAKKLMLAAKSMDKAIKQQPQNPEALFTRAQIAQQSGESKQAIKFIEAALKIDNAPANYHLLKAEALRAEDSVSKAIEELEKAVNTVQDALPVQLARARLLEQNGDVQESLTLLKELALEAPDNAEILLSLSEVLQKAGRTQDAIQAAQQAVRHSADMASQEQAHLRHHLGCLLEEAGQLDQAIEHLGEAINLDPNTAEPHVELACAYKLRRQYPQALEHFQQAIALAPQDPRAYWESAQILKDSKDYEGAQTMLRHAAGLAPDDVNVQRQLAAVVALNLVHPTNEAAIQA